MTPEEKRAYVLAQLNEGMSDDPFKPKEFNFTAIGTIVTIITQFPKDREIVETAAEKLYRILETKHVYQRLIDKWQAHGLMPIA